MTFSNVGIIGYGAELPSTCILTETIEAAHGKGSSGTGKALGVFQKTVPGVDEDSATLAVCAGLQAVTRSQSPVENIGALFVGSESHPYAVKPTGTIVSAALGLPKGLAMADLQFACKAGTQGVQIVSSYVEAGLISSGLAIGADTAQARPGDVLEYTAGAGAAAFVLGSSDVLVKIRASVSVASDTPDFWRRPGQPYPEHAGRFSGEPGYFSHVEAASTTLLHEVGGTFADIDYCVFHTPNGKFPRAVAGRLGFQNKQLEDSLIVDRIGNTYAAASLLALVALLDIVGPEKTILLTSYGSGAGADAFLLETTPLLVKQRQTWSGFLREKIDRLESISYEQYREQTAGTH